MTSKNVKTEHKASEAICLAKVFFIEEGDMEKHVLSHIVGFKRLLSQLVSVIMIHYRPAITIQEFV